LLPVTWGLQLRQARLDDLIFSSLLHVPALPGPPSSPLGPVMYDPPTDNTAVTTSSAHDAKGDERPPAAGLDRDVMVVGAGVAGLTAAWHALDSGVSAAVVTKGWSSLIWHTGTIDILGRLPGRPEPVENPAAAIAELMVDTPDHPYAMVGIETVEQAVRWILDLTADAGYRLEGSFDSNFLLPTGLGAARPTCLAPRTMVAGDLRRPDPMLIVGIRGFGDIYPHQIADNVATRGIPAEGVSVEVPTVDRRRFVTSQILASMLDQPDIRDELVRAIKATGRSAPRIGLPP